MTKPKTRRTRITKQDIARAREYLLKPPEKKPLEDTEPTPKAASGRWKGSIYCTPEGWAWITDLRLELVCLGRADEVLAILKNRKVDPEDVAEVLQAVEEYRGQKKTQSYHSATKNSAGGMNGHGAKLHRITFKENPQFLRLLDGLIQKGYGLPTMQRALRAKGYDVPYATLGRWAKKRKLAF